MSFRTELSKKVGIPESDLPRGYQMIGDIIILQLKEGLDEKKIGEAVLSMTPYAKTVCKRTGEIRGEFRQPQIKRIAGNGTETIHNEHGCKFLLDVARIMWAKGNISERKRVGEIAKKNEVIIDMFSGIGYFSIPLAVISAPRRIYSIEKNKEAYDYLCKNIKLNKVETIITPILGDSYEKTKECEKADRIIMGILPAPKEFLPSAFKALKNKGVIHYEGVCEKEKTAELFRDVKEEGLKQGFECKLLKTTIVKSYGPKKYHAVVDVNCEKK